MYVGIAGTALALFGGNLFGGLGGNTRTQAQGDVSGFQSWEKAANAELADQKALYEFALLSADARYQDRSRIDAEMFGLYKTQTDADFALYKGQRDSFDVLSNRINKLEVDAAVTAAIEPWRSKVTKMEIGNVLGAVNLEAERRMCADNTIVNYANNTFYPISVADNDVNTTATSRSTYNPLNTCNCQ